MLQRIYTTVKDISSETTFVVGYEKDAIIAETKSFDGTIHIAEQKKAIGTSDAVKSALPSITKPCNVLVLYGDVPLIKQDTLEKLITETKDGLTILSTIIDSPYAVSYTHLTLPTILRV